jgi:hypothetical protein
VQKKKPHKHKPVPGITNIEAANEKNFDRLEASNFKKTRSQWQNVENASDTPLLPKAGMGQQHCTVVFGIAYVCRFADCQRSGSNNADIGCDEKS